MKTLGQHENRLKIVQNAGQLLDSITSSSTTGGSSGPSCSQSALSKVYHWNDQNFKKILKFRQKAVKPVGKHAKRSKSIISARLCEDSAEFPRIFSALKLKKSVWFFYHQRLILWLGIRRSRLSWTVTGLSNILTELRMHDDSVSTQTQKAKSNGVDVCKGLATKNELFPSNCLWKRKNMYFRSTLQPHSRSCAAYPRVEGVPSRWCICIGIF